MGYFKKIICMIPLVLSSPWSFSETAEPFTGTTNSDNTGQARLMDARRTSQKLTINETLNSVTLNVNGEFITLRTETLNYIDDNHFQIVAKSNGDNDRVYLSRRGHNYFGFLTRNNTSYKIRPSEYGVVSIQEISPEELEDHTQHDHEHMALAKPTNYVMARSVDSTGTPWDSPRIITVLVGYTHEFALTVDDISTYLDQVTFVTNQSFINSGLDMSIQIVHSYQADYNDTANMVDDLEFFAQSDGDEAQRMRKLRDNYNADISVLLTGNNYHGCGLGYVNATQASAFAVAKESCAVENLTFAHEIGHIFGAQHNLEAARYSPFVYGHGYCNPTANTWRSVMAYRCPGSGGSRKPVWSNPELTYWGYIGGTFEQENNARVLRERASKVANFRKSYSTALFHATML